MVSYLLPTTGSTAWNENRTQRASAAQGWGWERFRGGGRSRGREAGRQGGWEGEREGASTRAGCLSEGGDSLAFVPAP